MQYISDYTKKKHITKEATRERSNVSTDSFLAQIDPNLRSHDDIIKRRSMKFRRLLECIEHYLFQYHRKQHSLEYYNGTL